MPIDFYDVNKRDIIRRAYLQRGPCQPVGHTFQQIIQGKVNRRFVPSWFDEFPNWLEYSIAKEAAFCLCCYVFKPNVRKHPGSCDAFVEKGFSNWKRKEKLQEHVGGPNSAHNEAWKKCVDLMNEKTHIEPLWDKNSKKARNDYRIRLTASTECARFLLRQGMAFRGHDESIDSVNQGNFIELLKFLAKHNEDIAKVCLENSPGNLRLMSSDVQKDLVSACAVETTLKIIKELGNAFFSIMMDEVRDVSMKSKW